MKIRVDEILSVINSNNRVHTGQHDIIIPLFHMPRKKALKPKGVYLLGDFYVGRSANIATRMINHSSVLSSDCKSKINSTESVVIGARKWFKRFPGKPILAFHLSDNEQDEYLIAKELIERGFPIENAIHKCAGYFEFAYTKQEIKSIEFLRSLGYKVIAPDHRKDLEEPIN